jgi:hypothetical protein
MNEIWRPVVGFEGVYEVSDHGRVKRIMGGRGAVTGKILSLNRLNKKGYATVWLHKFINGVQVKKFMTTHHVVAAAFLPPQPTPDHQVNHKDGVKTNNCADNLEWVTNQENMDHSWRMGLRSYIGENNHTAKLTEDDVKRIIELKGIVKQREIAQEYGVAIGAIKAIHEGVTWKHITRQPDVANQLKTAVIHTFGGPKGEANKNAKLTEQQVIEIKRLLPTHQNKTIAQMYGVSRDTIYHIRIGRLWKHVQV